MKRVAAKNNKKKEASVREQILQSMVASFKIEGITIPADLANSALRKIEISLEKEINLEK